MNSMQTLLATVRRREATLNVTLGVQRVLQLLVMLAAVAFVLHLTAIQHSSHLSHGEHAGSAFDVHAESSAETPTATSSGFDESAPDSPLATAFDVGHEFECDEPSALRGDTTLIAPEPALPCLQVAPPIELTYPLPDFSDQVRRAPDLVCELCVQRI